MQLPPASTPLRGNAMTQTKTERLVNFCGIIAHDFKNVIAPHCGRSFAEEIATLHEIGTELRRLSQIEAQNMKSPSHVHTWCTKDQVDVIAEKISRLAPMEAERDKLLAVNKALVEAFEKQLRSIPALQDGGGFVIDHLDCSGEYIGSQNIDPLQVVQELCSIANAALKLAGEIK
jgi:hypothetical protein